MRNGVGAGATCPAFVNARSLPLLELTVILPFKGEFKNPQQGPAEIFPFNTAKLQA